MTDSNTKFDALYQLTAAEIAERLPQNPDKYIGAYQNDEPPEKSNVARPLYHYSTIFQGGAKEEQRTKLASNPAELEYTLGLGVAYVFSRDEMMRYADRHQDVLLDPPVPARQTERLFLDSWGGVWIADKKTPFSDPNIRPVGPLPERP